jgi:hypothetical protein
MDTYVFWSILFGALGFAVSCLVHWYYTKLTYHRIPLFLHGCIVLSLWICVSPFLLLILDVDAAAGAAHDGSSRLSYAPWMKLMWVLLFAATQVLAWILLPLCQEYAASGGFTVRQRIHDSIRSNVYFYVVIGGVVGVLFGYVVFMKGIHTEKDVLDLAVAISNAFGLILIVIFLALGLVGIPRSLWRMSDAQSWLDRSCAMAPELKDELDNIKMELIDVKSAVAELQSRACRSADVDDTTKSYVDRVNCIIDEYIEGSIVGEEMRSTTERRSSVAPDAHPCADFGVDSEAPTVRQLNNLHARVKDLLTRQLRREHEWASLGDRCRHLQDMVGKNDPPPATHVALYVRYAYWKHVRRPFLRLAAGLFALLGVTVLWSELVVPFNHFQDRQLSIVEAIVVGHHQRKNGMQFVGLTVFLCYMATATYWAAFRLKVFDTYRLVPSVTDAASMCFTCTFLTRLILPLCCNFLWLANLTDASKHYHISYLEMFGSINVVVFLGPWFNRMIPVFVPVMAVLILLNVFDRLWACLGITAVQPSQATDTVMGSAVVEGRALLGLDRRPGNVEIAVSAGSVKSSHSAGASSTTSNANSSDGDGGARPARGQRYEEWKKQRALKDEQQP